MSKSGKTVGGPESSPHHQGLSGYGKAFTNYTGNIKSGSHSFKPAARKSPHGGNVKSSIGKKPAR